LLAVSSDSWGLKGHAIGIDENPPSLFAQVSYEQADGSQLDTVAIIYVSAGESAQCVRETRRQPRSEIQEVMKLLTFTWG
jgi:hypothetical protein